MSFVRACAVDDVPADEALGVVVGEVEVALARHGEDFYALYDVCSHAQVTLSEGDVEDCSIECWLHGSTFDLRTGKPSGPPALDPVATFPVEVRDDGLYVDTTTTLNGVPVS